jgi:hypothetical protein
LNVVKEKKTDDKETFEKLLAEPETGARYVLRLYVTGDQGSLQRTLAKLRSGGG